MACKFDIQQWEKSLILNTLYFMSVWYKDNDDKGIFVANAITMALLTHLPSPYKNKTIYRQIYKYFDIKPLPISKYHEKPLLVILMPIIHEISNHITAVLENQIMRLDASVNVLYEVAHHYYSYIDPLYGMKDRTPQIEYQLPYNYTKYSFFEFYQITKTNINLFPEKIEILQSQNYFLLNIPNTLVVAVANNYGKPFNLQLPKSSDTVIPDLTLLKVLDKLD